MADPARTEKATPKRREEAREKGQVARSVEVNSVIILLAALLAFRCAGPYMLDAMGRLTIFTYQNLNTSFGMENVYNLVLFYMWQVFKIIAPILVVILLVSLAVNYLQVGVLFTIKPLTPKFTNLNPITGFQKLFSRRSAVEFVKSLLKLLIIGWCGYAGVKSALPDLVPTMDMQGAESLKFVGLLTLKVLDWILLALVALALLDFFYQKWEYEDSLKMTKQEIRDEYKQTEGDPMIKARIRQNTKEKWPEDECSRPFQERMLSLQTQLMWQWLWNIKRVCKRLLFWPKGNVL